MRVLTKSRESASAPIKTLLETAPYILNARISLTSLPGGIHTPRPVPRPVEKRTLAITNTQDLASTCRAIARSRQIRYDWLAQVEQFVGRLPEPQRRGMSLRIADFKRGLLRAPKFSRYIVPKDCLVELKAYPNSDLLYPSLRPMTVPLSQNLLFQSTPSWPLRSAILPQWTSLSNGSGGSRPASEYSEASRRMLERATDYHFSAVVRPETAFASYKPKSGDFIDNIGVHIDRLRHSADEKMRQRMSADVVSAFDKMLDSLTCLKVALHELLAKQNYLAEVSQDRTRMFGLEKPLISYCEVCAESLIAFIEDVETSLRRETPSQDMCERALSKLQIITNNVLCTSSALDNCQEKRLDVTHVTSIMQNILKAPKFSAIYTDPSARYQQNYNHLLYLLRTQQAERMKMDFMSLEDAEALGELSAKVCSTPKQQFECLQDLIRTAEDDQQLLFAHITPEVEDAQHEHPLNPVKQGFDWMLSKAVKEGELVLSRYQDLTDWNFTNEQEDEFYELFGPKIDKLKTYKSLVIQIVLGQLKDFEAYSQFLLECARCQWFIAGEKDIWSQSSVFNVLKNHVEQLTEVLGEFQRNILHDAFKTLTEFTSINRTDLLTVQKANELEVAEQNAITLYERLLTYLTIPNKNGVTKLNAEVEITRLTRQLALTAAVPMSPMSSIEPQ